MSSHVDTTESEDTPKSLVRCQKIRLRPTTKQAQKLREWMKAARDTYNSALRLIKDGKAKPNLLLKKLVVTRRKEDGPKVQQMKKTPADIRSRAIMDLIDAFKTAQAGFKARKLRERTQKSRWRKRKKKEKNLGRRRWRKRVAYHIKYKSKRLTSDSFGFEGTKSMDIKNGEVFLFSGGKSFGMEGGIKMSELPIQPIDACCRIQYCFGRWYLLLPYQAEKEDPRLVDGRVGALDPGVRTFQAFYSEDECGEIAPDMDKVALAMRKKISGIRELIDILKNKGGYRLKINRLTKAWYRANARASNLASDLHFKTIKFLFNRFDVIIAPRLNVGSMLRSDGNLNANTKATMRFQQHGAFHGRLRMKAESCGKIILDLEEHGTSQTCSSCGQANRKLGSAKVFKCPRCGFQADRDVNSSKNHLLKALVGKKNY
jgi:putative transposase